MVITTFPAPVKPLFNGRKALPGMLFPGFRISGKFALSF